MKKIIIIIVIVVATLGLGVILFTQSEKTQPEAGDVISKNGMHWHAKLAVFIKGQQQSVPKDIGIGTVHKPFHTHDDTGELHLEFSGLVTKQDTKLSQFFKNWNKVFNSNCIFEFCNSQEGKVQFLVNGQENKESDNYEVKDKDNLEIRYE
ncbi:MAG: hypothetical protein HYZ51_02055 [Candidatus Doudnabacteria bacterium]|nr:hypothetical protein [Candidatus Doudnabacteria bacterium]